MIKDKRIGILAVQETHLNEVDTQAILNLYGKRLAIFPSHNPESSNSAGIAFVVNKDLVNVKGIKHEEFVPGRAACISISWQNNEVLSLLNVYAPNQSPLNTQFWTRLYALFRSNPRLFHVMLGDMNMVEDSRDRLPAREDDHTQMLAFQKLTRLLAVYDGWRSRFPEHTIFSYPARPMPSSQSRIDRIYLREPFLSKSEGWRIEGSTVQTDHKLVLVQISNQNSPFLGKGRWSLNLAILRNKTVSSRLREAVASLQRNLRSDDPRTETSNPQTNYCTFKLKLREILREASKAILPQMSQTLAKMQVELDILLCDPEVNLDEGKKLEAALLQDRILQLQVERRTNLQAATSAHCEVRNETVSKFWINLNKAKKPRDIFFSMEKPQPDLGEDQYERRSDKMAQMARDYHDELQRNYQDHDTSKEDATNIVLEQISASLNKRSRTNIKRIFSPQDVRAALYSTAPGRASGLDGLPYELWKFLATLESAPDQNGGKVDLDIYDCLSTVFNDIQNHGLLAESTFAEGWLCPIYKQKGDRRNISNHRPITLLNTDYKLLTKILAGRLASTAPRLIHHNQAGFIPGRSIMDQIRLSEMMVAYAEATEENGVIVALDQEKAYDKIDHTYLWRTLEKFGFHPTTINLIKTLYSRAYTRVAINGVLSEPFLVTRGVRQGDPMSCLLFDLAIEPLAASLRNSDLVGFNIPTCRERLITTLFADDTTVYLNEDNDYCSLWKILDIWCAASTAKFNVSKTKIIPVGAPLFRGQTLTRRRWNDSMRSIPATPDAPDFVPDGTHTRILGAKIGNSISHEAIWSPILAKTEDTLALWAKGHPTLRGKKLIIQMFVGGYTQFLTSAHGMSNAVVRKFETVIRRFLWGNTRPKIALTTLSAPIERGGIGLLDLSARNDAIEVMWLKSYLSTSNSRPTWTYLADVLLASAASKSSGKVDSLAAKNPFIQYWKVAGRSKSLPDSLKRMLTTGKRYKVSMAPLRVTRRLRRAMPAWFHAGSTQKARKLQNTPAAKCLRKNHLVTTVSDLLRVSKRTRRQAVNDTHFQFRGCPCSGCKHDIQFLHCKHPISCQSTAVRILETLSPMWTTHQRTQTDGLSLTPNRKSINTTAFSEGSKVLFNPSVTTHESLGHLFRIFCTRAPGSEPIIRVPMGLQVEIDLPDACLMVLSRMTLGVKTYGVGISFQQDDPRNKALHLGPTTTSETEAWILGLTALVQSTPPFHPIHAANVPTHIISLVCFRAQVHEDEGWVNYSGPVAIRNLLADLRTRTASSSFAPTPPDASPATLLDAAALADLAFLNPAFWQPAPILAPDLRPEGASLMAMTQRLAYKLIRRQTTLPHRKGTEHNLARILATFSLADPRKVWRASRHPSLSRSAQSFFYNAINSTYSLGTYWQHVPDREHLVHCPYCQIPETVEHIIVDCDLPARRLVWYLAQNLLSRKGVQLPPVSLPSVLGCGLTQLKGRPGATRLLQIITSEAASLLWKLRCERRIKFQDDPSKCHSREEITNRWYLVLDKRVNLEKRMTHSRFGSQALDKSLVLKTWSGTLHEEHLHPDDWTSWKPRVLVGRGPPDT